MPAEVSHTTATRIHKSAGNIAKLLLQQNMDLTIGGEPTFVPLQPDGEEWGPAALGPTKLVYARKMAYSFLQVNHPGALISLHSGKHYPGEPIPRWQLTVQWRSNKILWKSPRRLLLKPVKDPKPPVTGARRMMKTIASELKLTRFVRPLLETDVTRPAAWALPLNYDDQRGWVSRCWGDAGENIILIPGDSSTGLRMPLDEVAAQGSRAALTVSANDDGGLEIFIPPMHVKPYDRLLAVIEKTAARLDARNLVISGYRPSGCDHTESLSMVSDPGVLEVNLPPARTWSNHCKTVKQVYAAAKASGLRAEKFLHNGEHHGTGGGSHLCFGGSDPSRSPFVQIPHLLPSIIRYWNHHPALSYLFTGQFIGPGCQAPRVDESNPHLIPELEIALKNIPQDPWDAVELHQRLIHFFIDASGNTHRSEISMDKLSNPLMPNGNLGIIEFRAIESQPTPQEWGRIVLLFQGLIAMLAKYPYRKALRAPSRSFQDLNFLPSVLEADLSTVLRDLKTIGTELQIDDYRPHLKRRSPILGTLNSGSSSITIRQALESWPLLSELPSGQSTTRPVDSSFARIECRLDTTSRALRARSYIRINGHAFPFRRYQEWTLLGLKFRTFHQTDGFHPHIPGQCPLHFEWVDGRTGKVLDAGTWHHWNPLGKTYTKRPGERHAAQRLCRQRWISLKPVQRYPAGMPKQSSRNLTEDLRQN
ncbi:MAG: transglutaminase family protein [Verrucomicrobiota bacterium]